MLSVPPFIKSKTAFKTSHFLFSSKNEALTCFGEITEKVPNDFQCGSKSEPAHRRVKLTKYIACICEGAAEKAIMELLLDTDKLT